LEVQAKIFEAYTIPSRDELWGVGERQAMLSTPPRVNTPSYPRKIRTWNPNLRADFREKTRLYDIFFHSMDKIFDSIAN